MPTTLLVKAAAGIKYPLQGYPSKYITEAEAQEVEDAAYYQKALLDGDLVLAAAPVAAPVVAALAADKSKT